MSEKELIEGAKKRDARSQRALFDRYSPILMGVCLRYCRTRAEAEDALQESFIRIFDKLDLYDFRGSFEGWMKRLTVNVALKGYQRKRFTHEQSGIDSIPERGGAPTAYAQLGEQELMALIHELPEGYRLVFNLYAIEGYSHKEIAETLGIQEASSRSQLLKARKLLQRKIEHQQRIAI
jgi:RNA polymerase sigma-70 factor (ECF subfamily)